MDTMTLTLDSRIDLNVLDNYVIASGVKLTYMQEDFNSVTIDVAGDAEDLDYFEEEILQYESQVIAEEESYD